MHSLYDEPYADFNCLALPEDAAEKQDDYVMLSDIFPTGWHATELAGLLPRETVAIYGAGPVGLIAAHSAAIKGAARVFVVDAHDDRLALAKSLGVLISADIGPRENASIQCVAALISVETHR